MNKCKQRKWIQMYQINGLEIDIQLYFNIL